MLIVIYHTLSCIYHDIYSLRTIGLFYTHIFILYTCVYVCGCVYISLGVTEQYQTKAIK